MDHGLAWCASNYYERDARMPFVTKTDEKAATEGHQLPIHRKHVHKAFADACVDCDSVLVLPAQHSPLSLHERHQSCHVCTPHSVARGTLRRIMH